MHNAPVEYVCMTPVTVVTSVPWTFDEGIMEIRCKCCGQPHHAAFQWQCLLTLVSFESSSAADGAPRQSLQESSISQGFHSMPFPQHSLCKCLGEAKLTIFKILWDIHIDFERNSVGNHTLSLWYLLFRLYHAVRPVESSCVADASKSYIIWLCRLLGFICGECSEDLLTRICAWSRTFPIPIQCQFLTGCFMGT